MSHNLETHGARFPMQRWVPDIQQMPQRTHYASHLKSNVPIEQKPPQAPTTAALQTGLSNLGMTLSDADVARLSRIGGAKALQSLVDLGHRVAPTPEPIRRSLYSPSQEFGRPDTTTAVQPAHDREQRGSNKLRDPDPVAAAGKNLVQESQVVQMGSKRMKDLLQSSNHVDAARNAAEAAYRQAHAPAAPPKPSARHAARKLLTKFESLRSVFLKCERDVDGSVHKDKLKEFLTTCGMQLSADEVNQIVTVAASNGPQVTYSDFAKVLDEPATADAPSAASSAPSSAPNSPSQKRARAARRKIQRRMAEVFGSDEGAVRKLFLRFKHAPSGRSTLNDMLNGLREFGAQLTPSDLKAMLGVDDVNGAASITFADFGRALDVPDQQPTVNHPAAQKTDTPSSATPFAPPEDEAARVRAVCAKVQMQLQQRGVAPRVAFLHVDADKDGRLTWEEIRSGLQSIGVSLSNADAETLTRTLDPEQSGIVRYDRFVSALYPAPKDNQLVLDQRAPRQAWGDADSVAASEASGSIISESVPHVEVPPDRILNRLLGRDADVRSLFLKLDVKHDGAIDAAELQAGLQRIGTTVSAAQAQQMIRMLDRDGVGTVRFSDFVQAAANGFRDAPGPRAPAPAAAAAAAPAIASLADHAALVARLTQKRSDMRKVFLSLDRDEKGRVSVAALRDSFARLGVEATKAQIDAFVGPDAPASLTFQEFLARVGPRGTGLPAHGIVVTGSDVIDDDERVEQFAMKTAQLEVKPGPQGPAGEIAARKTVRKKLVQPPVDVFQGQTAYAAIQGRPAEAPAPPQRSKTPGPMRVTDTPATNRRLDFAQAVDDQGYKVVRLATRPPPPTTLANMAAGERPKTSGGIRTMPQRSSNLFSDLQYPN